MTRAMNVSRIDPKNVDSQKMDASSKSICPQCGVRSRMRISKHDNHSHFFRNNLPVVWIWAISFAGPRGRTENPGFFFSSYSLDLLQELQIIYTCFNVI